MALPVSAQELRKLKKQGINLNFDDGQPFKGYVPSEKKNALANEEKDPLAIAIESLLKAIAEMNKTLDKALAASFKLDQNVLEAFRKEKEKPISVYVNMPKTEKKKRMKFKVKVERRWDDLISALEFEEA